MTFQIALIGSDGIVCGSDRRIVDRRSVIHPYLKDEEDTVEFNSRTTGTKIIHTANIACAFAGGPNAEIIARIIISEESPEGLDLIEWQNRVAAIAQKIGGSGGRILDEVLIIRKCDPRAAIRLLVQGNDKPSPFVFRHGICTGDVVQAARLFVEQLCDEESPLMPVAILERIALLSVAYASKENPSGIGGGCEILTLTQNQGFNLRRYSSKDTERVADEFTAGLKQLISNIDIPEPFQL